MHILHSSQFSTTLMGILYGDDINHMRGSRNFRQGGGVQVNLTKKLLRFFSLQLILQKSNGEFQRKLSFFKVPEGSNIFKGGGPTFSSRGGGVQLL